ncbi:MAG TPA: hypothetical protein DDZ39_11605 [Flavobacteriaceae bacterium]|jgi:hypothetical protein|nr:hypothetical protein [Flavobacteriaceae bacterium]
MKKQVILYEKKLPGISIHINANITKGGGLQIEGIDTGENVENIWGSWDYEYYINTDKKNKNNLIKQLIKQGFKINNDMELLIHLQQYYACNEAYTEIHSLLTKENIEFQTFTWA